jgi:superfamily II DNA or RNA helicase
MELTNLVLEKKDDVYLRIWAEPGVEMELGEHFTFFVPGYQHMPKFRNKMWDGKIRLYNRASKCIYLGLLPQVLKFVKDNGYGVEWNKPLPENKPYDIYQAKRFFDSMPLHSHGKVITARDYQCDALAFGLNHKRALLVSPTASGKSLIMYGLIRYFLQSTLDDYYEQKILIIVPTINLVAQLYSDFEDYSKFDDSFNVAETCHMIHGGLDKKSDKPVHISTWQSIYKEPKKFFEDYRMVLGDEAHGFQAKSLVDIMEKLTECPYKIGLTGTLQDAKTHKLVLQGVFGQEFDVITTKELMDRGQVAKLNITCLLLKYNNELSRLVGKADYDQEMEFLQKHERRNKFVRNLVASLEGNTLALFRNIEHGKLLFDMIRKKVPAGRNVYFVYGKTAVEDREFVRKIVEDQQDAIIVGSYGTLSTGADIQHLHNVVFASPYKSKIKNLQSIGRSLRIGELKSIATLYDLADDLSYTTKRGNLHRNHALNHFIYRTDLYSHEQFDFTTIKVDI